MHLALLVGAALTAIAVVVAATVLRSDEEAASEPAVAESGHQQAG